MKPMTYKDLPNASLFRIFAEKKAHYAQGERKIGMVRSTDGRVYKKHGSSFAQTKDGHTIILALGDLVLPYEPRKSVPAAKPVTPARRAPVKRW